MKNKITLILLALCLLVSGCFVSSCTILGYISYLKSEERCWQEKTISHPNSHLKDKTIEYNYNFQNVKFHVSFPELKRRSLFCGILFLPFIPTFGLDMTPDYGRYYPISLKVDNVESFDSLEFKDLSISVNVYNTIPDSITVSCRTSQSTHKNGFPIYFTRYSCDEYDPCTINLYINSNMDTVNSLALRFDKIKINGVADSLPEIKLERKTKLWYLPSVSH